MWLTLVLALSASPGWPDTLGTGRTNVIEVVRPRASQLREAFDDLDRAMKLWQRERRELLDEQTLEQQRVSQKQRDEAPLPEAALKGYKVIDVGKTPRKGKGRSKVIELEARDKVDTQLEELSAEIAERRAVCKSDPVRCEREKKQREALQRGNAAWDEAVTASYEKRREAIEAEARRFQNELDAAKKREEQRQAEKLGGGLDREGNFVDSDLKEVPERSQ
ncbi:MAG: hypothetical protein JNK82_42450 [Myxococcaceae bacterium]|nr:hypothetical protein [Myxococcaceae bacterium]